MNQNYDFMKNSFMLNSIQICLSVIKKKYLVKCQELISKAQLFLIDIHFR